MSASAPAPAPAPAARRRPGLAGILTLGLWLAFFTAIVVYLVSRFDIALVARFGPLYLSGFWTTISLVAISILAGAVVSLPVALGRRSKNPFARALAFAFVSFFRGTPLIAQIFLVYYGFGSFRAQFEAVNLSFLTGTVLDDYASLSLWSFFREPWYCAIFSLALNTAAYQAEILRGAVESVPHGQWEGARSLGLSRPVIFLRVVFPQAMIVALRPYANEIILLVKASAIVAIITVFDLFGETRRAYAKTFDFQTYVWAAVFYLVLVEALRHATNAVERRLTLHLVR